MQLLRRALHSLGERSRYVDTILEEFPRLAGEGVKELLLLGQNVNSYHDKSAGALQARPDASYSTSSPGFKKLYRLRKGGGYYFADVVADVSDLFPALCVRFTSPHSKDFPPTSWRSSLSGPTSASLCICPRRATARLHLRLLWRDGGRAPGRTVTHDGKAVRPGVHVRVRQREKTQAHRALKDDVAPATKQRRLAEVIEVFREKVQQRNVKSELGTLRVVLVDGDSRSSVKEERESKERQLVAGRNAAAAGLGDSGQERKECQWDRPLRPLPCRLPSHRHRPQLGRRLRQDLPP